MPLTHGQVRIRWKPKIESQSAKNNEDLFDSQSSTFRPCIVDGKFQVSNICLIHSHKHSDLVSWMVIFQVSKICWSEFLPSVFALEKRLNIKNI
jgi:hypothetical protein